jgi:molybdopterin converting factor small subunit
VATVILPRGLLRYTGGVERVEVEADDLRGLMAALEERFPGIGAELRTGMSASINGEIIPDPFLEPVPAGAEVHFLPRLRGG